MATQQVLETTELLEMILLGLSFHELLAFRRVSRA